MSQGHKQNERKPRLLLLIASMKLVKAAFLITAGVAALELIDPTIGQRLLHWTEEIQHDFSRDVVLKALHKILNLDSQKLRLVAFGTFLYAGLFVTEGIGLWMDKRWAEWLTIVSTAGLIPIEIYELAKELNPVRIAVLIANVLVVIYLIVRLRYKHLHP
jgi:uncharacterized membrane protein (DUF2068 family)